MRFFYFGLILYTISVNQAHAKVSWIEQKSLMVSEQDADMDGNGIYDLTEPFTDRNNNNQYDYAEDFVDVNKNGVYDYQENYQDDNQNEIWDDEEPFIDRNSNGSYDAAEKFIDINNNGLLDLEEPFTDQGNGVYDLGEDFTDINNNNICDLELWYVDQNRNGKWDGGDPFEDLNNNGERDYKEPYTDQNNNNWYDAPEKVGDSKFNFSAMKLSESFTDSPNGTYDNGEEYEDLNGDGQWTSGEKYEDKNGIWNKVEEESVIYDTLMTSWKNITIEEKPGSGLKSYKSSVSFKSPGKALLYSAVLPGMGQTYMSNWLRGLIFVGLDVVAIGTWYYNNNLAEDKKKEYKYYANEHWDLGRWIHDYYKWYPADAPVEFAGSQELWESVREPFVNNTDTTGFSDCDEYPHCYIDIWNHSHKVEFTYDGSTVSSSSDEFKDEIFEDLCGNSWNHKKCSNEVVSLYDNNGDTINVIKSHHFYEGIQKYDMFFAGWDDNDSIFVAPKEHNDKNATSPNQIAYRSLWCDYNKIKTLAGNGGKFMLINRVVSMVDALLLAKKWNNSHDINLSLNAYPDLRNKSGLGGVKLSLHWK